MLFFSPARGVAIAFDPLYLVIRSPFTPRCCVAPLSLT